jgi:hypothetical protein
MRMKTILGGAACAVTLSRLINRMREMNVIVFETDGT